MKIRLKTHMQHTVTDKNFVSGVEFIAKQDN